jgi:WD40 repeat protein
VGYPALAGDAEALLDCIYNEYVLRTEQGESPEPAEYQARFPHLAAQLAMQFSLESALQSLEDGSEGPNEPPMAEQGAPEGRAAAKSTLLRSALTDFGNRESEEAAIPRVSGYEVLGELGRGGMGVVYKARQLALNRLVALKMIPAHADPEHQRRLKAEAEVVARLRHPNFVQIYDYALGERRPYLALEFVEGGTLAQKAAGVPQPPHRAAQIVETLAAAVHHAHREGLVHRDLKPANVLLTAEGVLKIADFGLAKRLAGERGVLAPGDQTATGALLGTPTYMAPEQVAGQRGAVGTATDVYALGVILYELLTGRPPFQGDSVLEVLRQVQEQEPLPPGRLQPGTPRDLETICLKCLQKEPRRRYAGAQALADDLRRFQAGEPIAARPVGPLGRTWRWSRRNPGWAAMLASLAALVLIIIIGTTLGMARLQTALNTSERNLDRATQAEKDTQRQVFDARLEQAQSNHRSRRSGQRFATLDVVRQAVQQGRKVNVPAAELDELRNIAIAALAMPDAYPAKSWDGFPPGSHWMDFDDTLTIYARTDDKGNCDICRRTGGGEVVHHPLPGLKSAPAYHGPRLSRDGRFVAVIYQDGRMQLWKLDGPEPEVWFEAKRVRAIDFRADSGQAIVAHSDGSLTHYDLAKRRSRSLPPNPDQLVEEVNVALHPTEPLVALCSYHYHDGVVLRDLRTGGIQRILPLPRGAFGCAWHPDGRMLATGGNEGDPQIRVFDATTGRLLRHFGRCAVSVVLTFNHAGDRLLAADTWSGGFTLWDARAGRSLLTLPPSVFYTTNLRFSRDDQLLGPCVEGSQVSVWRVGDAREYRTLQRHLKPPSEIYICAAVHPQGRLLAVGMNNGVGFWDLATGEELRYLATGPVGALLFEVSPALQSNQDTDRGSGLLIGSLGVWRCSILEKGLDPATYEIGRPQQVLKVGASGIASSDDRSVVGIASRRVSGNYKPGAWICSKKFETVDALAPGEDIVRVAVSPDGRWLVTSTHETGTVKIWETRTRQAVKELPGRSREIQFSPDGRWLATKDRLWRVGPTIADWFEGPELGRSNGSFVFSPDSRLLAIATSQGQIRLFDPDKGLDIARLEDPDQHSCNLAFSPDGTKLLAVHAKEGVHVWDLRRIRAHLKGMDQDWDAEPYPPVAGQASEQGYRPPVEPGQSLLERGEEHARQGQWKKAVTDLSHAAEFPALRASALMHRSLASLQLGEPTKAEADREVLHGAFRNCAWRFNDLAWRYATGPEARRQPLQAVALAEKAVVLQPANFLHWNTLGVSYYRAGRFQDAVTALEKSLNPGAGRANAFDLYFLALAHHHLGHEEVARVCLKQAQTWHERPGRPLSASEAGELHRFRTEAETVLGKTRQKD